VVITTTWRGGHSPPSCVETSNFCPPHFAISDLQFSRIRVLGASFEHRRARASFDKSTKGTATPLALPCCEKQEPPPPPPDQSFSQRLRLQSARLLRKHLPCSAPITKKPLPTHASSSSSTTKPLHRENRWAGTGTRSSWDAPNPNDHANVTHFACGFVAGDDVESLIHFEDWLCKGKQGNVIGRPRSRRTE
jgi:hypothetical protein